MIDFLKAMLYISAPFIGLGLLLLLWAYIAFRLQHRFPLMYGLSIRLYDNLPKIGAVVVIGWLIYAFFTEPSYYDW